MKLNSVLRLVLVFATALAMNACGGTSTNTEAQESSSTEAVVKEEVSEQTKQAQAVVANFDEDFTSVKNPLDAYLLLKDALVATNSELAQKAASKMAELTETEVKTAAEGIAASNDIKEQRNLFNTISQQMYETLKTEGAKNTVYKQYCPMAFNNEGAYWLSSEEKIMNPYFGDMMLNCGRVDETLQAAAN